MMKNMIMTKILKWRTSEFSHGELRVGKKSLGIFIARYGPVTAASIYV